MPKRSEFVDFLLEQLSGLGDVSARRMFSGLGFYLDGRIFALMFEDTIYFKTDDVSRPEFEAAGLQPFTYDRADRTVTVTSYYEPPAGAIDDRELLCAWARKGIEASARVAAKKKPRKK